MKATYRNNFDKDGGLPLPTNYSDSSPQYLYSGIFVITISATYFCKLHVVSEFREKDNEWTEKEY